MDDVQRINSWEAAASVLGVAPDADEAEVRRAYLRLIKEHPPDEDPVQFERIRDANEFMSDPYRKLNRIFNVNPVAPLEAVIDTPCLVGPEPWIEAVRKMVQP